MATGNSVNDEKREQRKKFLTMTKEQKLSYFKTYYLGPTIVALLVIAFIIWFLLETLVFHKTVILSGATINVRISDESYEHLTTDMLGYLGGNPSKEIVNLSRDNYVDYDSEDEMNGYMDQTMLFTQIAAGEFSYLIVDDSAIDNIYDSGYIANLDELLGGDFLEEKGYELYCPKVALGEAKERYPVGIYLGNTSFGLDGYLVIASFTDEEMAKKIIDFIID